MYYYYNPETDIYFADRGLFPREWGYELLNREQYKLITGKQD